jgi:hypothetical protein
MEHVIKTIFGQNVNTGVFSLGDFLRDPVLSEWGDLRRDRESKNAFSVLLQLLLPFRQ